jgi:hypothetical protein
MMSVKTCHSSKSNRVPPWVSNLAMRLRVTKAVPEQKSVRIAWRRGGEGLGGGVSHGDFVGGEYKPQIATGDWSAWLSLKDVVGTARGWEFPTIVVSSEPVVQAG